MNTYSLVFTDGREYVLTQRIHLAQNSEYTRTNDGVNVPCLTPSPLRPSLPLLLPLLLEVLLVGRVRESESVSAVPLASAASSGGAAPRGSRRELVRLCIQNTMYSPMCSLSALNTY